MTTGSCRSPALSVTGALGVALLLAALGARAAPRIEDIVITPKYETSGIIVRSNADSVSLEIQTSSGFRPAHPFVRYDRNHLAASLFGLRPDTEYRIRIGGQVERTFRTLAEFSLPEPTQIVKVSTIEALQRAVDTARAGTTILVARGTYRGQVTVHRSGAAGRPIVIQGDVPVSDLPVWQRFDLPVIDARGHETGILIEGASHVVLDRLQVTGGDKHGVYLLRASHCVVQHMQIYDNGTWNLIISKGGATAGRHLIQYNHVADLEHGAFRFDYREQKGVTYYGIIQDNQGGWGTTIRGNRVEGHVDGISPSGDEHELRHIAEDHPDVLSTWINREVDVYDNVILDQRDDAIESDGVGVNMRIFRNRVRRAQNAVSIAPAGPGPFFFVRNLLADYNESGVKFNTADGRGVIRNIFFFHNTYSPGPDNRYGVLTLWAGTPSKNIVFRNNIFAGRIRAIDFQGLAHEPDMDNDLWQTRDPDEPRERFEQAGLRWEAHGVFGDPRLTGDFRLRRDSPAIDRAMALPGINDEYRGEAPDIGAFELSP